MEVAVGGGGLSVGTDVLVAIWMGLGIFRRPGPRKEQEVPRDEHENLSVGKYPSQSHRLSGGSSEYYP